MDACVQHVPFYCHLTLNRWLACATHERNQTDGDLAPNTTHISCRLIPHRWRVGATGTVAPLALDVCFQPGPFHAHPPPHRWLACATHERSQTAGALEPNTNKTTWRLITSRWRVGATGTVAPLALNSCSHLGPFHAHAPPHRCLAYATHWRSQTAGVLSPNGSIKVQEYRT